MNFKNKITEDGIYFITSTVHCWVDIFTRPEYKQVIVSSLQYCSQNKGLVIYAWVLMSNHLHMVAGTKDGYHLSDILRDFKKFTSKELIRSISCINESRKEWLLDRFEFTGRYNPKIKDYTVWQRGNEAKEVVKNEFMLQKINYIHQNPVKAEIVTEPWHYLYSSAIDYAGGKGLLDVVIAG